MIISDGMKDAESDIFALDALTSSQLNELGDWLKIYTRKYRCIGYLPGVYWSPMGDPSELLVNLVEAWNTQPPENIDFDELLPPCNSFFDGKKLRLSCNLYNRCDYLFFFSLLLRVFLLSFCAVLVILQNTFIHVNFWNQKKRK